jgi:hypothetical protein
MPAFSGSPRASASTACGKVTAPAVSAERRADFFLTAQSDHQPQCLLDRLLFGRKAASTLCFRHQRVIVIVAGFAVLIWVGTQWLEKVGVPYYIFMVTEGVAILFFALDILCLVVFVIAETLKLLRLMWTHAWE